MAQNRKDSFSGRKRFKTKKDKIRDKGSVEFSRDLGSRKDRSPRCGEDCDPCK